MLHSRAVDTTAVRPPAVAHLSALTKGKTPCRWKGGRAYLREESRYDLLDATITAITDELPTHRLSSFQVRKRRSPPQSC